MNFPPDALRNSRWVVAVVTVMLALWTFGTLFLTKSNLGLQWVNHDVASNLYTGRMAFAGRRLYVDWLDTNPPAILLLSGFIDWIARTIGVSPISLFHTVVLAVGLLGFLVIRAAYLQVGQSRTAVLVSLAYLVVLAGAGLPGDPSFTYSFGQKEHLFVLAFIPYLIVRLVDAKGRLVFPLALFAVGFAAACKPQFLMLMLVVEGFSFLRTRRVPWRGWMFIGAGVLLPFIGLLVHSPASVRSFPGEMFRLHAAGVYAFFDQDYSVFLRSGPHGWFLVYLAVLVCLSRSALRNGESKTGIGTFLVLPVVAYAVVVQQHKFWPYHSIILLGPTLVSLAHLAGRLVEDDPDHRHSWVFELLVVMLAAQVVCAGVELHRMAARWKEKGSIEVGENVLQAFNLLKGRPRALYYSTSNAHMRLPLFLQQDVVGSGAHDFSYPAMVRDPDVRRRRQRLKTLCEQQRHRIKTEKPDAIVFHSTNQALETSLQDLHTILVSECDVVPAVEYEKPLFPAPGVIVYLRAGNAAAGQGSLP